MFFCCSSLCSPMSCVFFHLGTPCPIIHTQTKYHTLLETWHNITQSYAGNFFPWEVLGGGHAFRSLQKQIRWKREQERKRKRRDGEKVQRKGLNGLSVVMSHLLTVYAMQRLVAKLWIQRRLSKHKSSQHKNPFTLFLHYFFPSLTSESPKCCCVLYIRNSFVLAWWCIYLGDVCHSEVCCHKKQRTLLYTPLKRGLMTPLWGLHGPSPKCSLFFFLCISASYLNYYTVCLDSS